jgi:hypothetical protein
MINRDCQIHLYMLKRLPYICLFFLTTCAFSQNKTFTHADTLRGSITPERAWWDLTFYHLNVRPDPQDSTLNGSTKVVYTILKPSQIIQIDLQEPLKINKAVQDGESLTFKRDGNAFFIDLKKKQEREILKQLKYSIPENRNWPNDRRGRRGAVDTRWKG